MPVSTARDRLLDAADAVFFADGSTHEGVDRVLAEAHVSVATLYAQFGSKDGLIAAALRRRLDLWDEEWADAIAAADDDEARLLAIFDALETYRRSYGEARWCAFLTTATAMSAPAPEVAQLLRQDTNLLRQRLADLSAPLTDQPEILTGLVMLAYNGTLAALLRGQPERPIEVGRELARSVVAGQRR